MTVLLGCLLILGTVVVSSAQTFYDFDVENVTCGGDVNMTEGSFESPGYPKPTDANVTCVWHIDRMENNGPTTLHFKALILTAHDSHILVYEGSSSGKLIANITESRAPFMLVSMAAVTTVVYYSGNNANNTAVFSLDYDNKGCQQNVSYLSDTIVSPVYLKGADFLCTYNVDLMVSDERMLILAFNKFTVAHGSVTIIADNQTFGPFTGIDIPNDVFSPVSKVTVELSIKNSTKEQKFTLLFATSAKDCTYSKQLTDLTMVEQIRLEMGTKHAGGCRYILTSPPKTTLLAIVTDVQLSKELDEIVFNDGGSQASERISVIQSTTKAGTSVVTSFNSIWIRFIADEMPFPRSFNLNVSIQSLTGRLKGSGSFEWKANSTAPPTPDASTYYQIVTPGSRQASVTISTMDMSSVYMLPAASLKFYDGTSINDPLIAKFGTKSHMYPVVSNSPNMLVVASDFDRLQHFSATFKGIAQGCNHVSTSSGDNYRIDRSPIGSSCSWKINPMIPGQIVLQIRSLMMGVNDTLQVNQGLSGAGPLLLKLQGGKPYNQIPPVFIPSMDGANIQFSQSVNASTENGLAPMITAEYDVTESDGCGGDVTSMTGYVQSPFFPGMAPLNAECTWSPARANHSVLYLTFTNLKIATRHRLMIGSTANESRHFNLTYSDTVVLPSDVITSYTSIFVSYSSKVDGAEELLADTFQINYRQIDCGGFLSSKKATLQTPGYPKSVNMPTECIWLVELPPRGQNDSVNIVTFNITAKHVTSSKHTFLVLRNGGSQRSAILPVNLTNDKPVSILSRTNLLWVQYVYSPKDTDSSGLSFTLQYSTYECKKADQCDNGVCMHPEWKCNGNDDCGDNSDERHCGAKTKTTVSATYIAVAAVLGVLLGLVVALVIPKIYKRFKYRNYDNLREIPPATI